MLFPPLLRHEYEWVGCRWSIWKIYELKGLEILYGFENFLVKARSKIHQSGLVGCVAIAWHLEIVFEALW